eukprot:1378197-Rhodomonas_salina.3
MRSVRIFEHKPCKYRTLSTYAMQVPVSHNEQTICHGNTGHRVRVPPEIKQKKPYLKYCVQVYSVDTSFSLSESEDVATPRASSNLLLCQCQTFHSKRAGRCKVHRVSTGQRIANV